LNIIETDFKFSDELQGRLETKYIILHHRAGPGDAECIHNQHLQRGYVGIGYHFYIRKDGSIYRGRPLRSIGAHCLNHNYNSVGVCFEGNFENEQMADAQKKSGKWLVGHLRGIFASVIVVGHKDMMATVCPGKNFPFKELSEAVCSDTEEVKELVSANDITWELSQKIKIYDIDGFVKALDGAKKENSPLYWGFYKIVNNQ